MCTYGTSGGVPLTEALIERLADEAEEGYKPDRIPPQCQCSNIWWRGACPVHGLIGR